MPSVADITVKKADETTNVTYTAYAPAAGDRSPAIWRNASVGSSTAQRPEARLSARPNGAGTARRVDFSYSYKQLATDTTTGVTSVINTLPISVSAAVPNGMTQTDIDEAVAQCMNLLASTLVKQCFKVAFGPT